MSSAPHVHVAVINWNTARSALEAVRAYTASANVEAQVTIVDNASHETERALLQANLPPGVELRLEDRNVGYGAAANTALQDTSAELVCVANADLIPAPEMLSRLAVPARVNRSLGLLAPRLEGARRQYHATLPYAVSLPLRAFAGSLGYRTIADPPEGIVLDVPQPAGACLLARAEVWYELGGFDESFFLWFEDVDIARRSLAAGYRNVVVGSAVARHAGGEAFSLLDSASKQEIRMRSLEQYVGKHHPRMLGPTRAAIALARPLRTHRASRRRLGEGTDSVTIRHDTPQ